MNGSTIPSLPYAEMRRALAALCLAAGLVWAPAAAPVPLTVLVDRAGLVALASVSTSSKHPGLWLDARIERVMKGSSPAVDLAVRFPRSPAVQAPVRGLRCVLFLERQGREWTVIPAVSGYISSLESALLRLPPGPRSPALAAGPARDRVLAELLRAEVPGVDYAGEYRRRRPEAPLRAIYRRLATHPDARRRAIGIRALLAGGGPAGVDILARNRRRVEHDTVYDDLRDAFQTRDPRSLEILASLAADDAAPLRLQYAANIALRRITGKAAR